MSGFAARQLLCQMSGTRYYGNGGTIHGTKHLHVETDKDGKVVAVWFRCQPVPFEQVKVGTDRALEMRRMTSGMKTELHGVEVKDIK